MLLGDDMSGANSATSSGGLAIRLRAISILALAALMAGTIGACAAGAGASKTSGFGTGAPPASATPGTATPVPAVSSGSLPAGQTIRLSEWKVEMASTTLKAGQATFTIANTGTTPHELLVYKSDLDPAKYPMSSAGFDEEGPGITKVSDGDNLDPGKSQVRTVDLTVPGKYLFVCNLPGHFAQHMYTVVTVTP